MVGVLCVGWCQAIHLLVCNLATKGGNLEKTSIPIPVINMFGKASNQELLYFSLGNLDQRISARYQMLTIWVPSEFRLGIDHAEARR